MSSAKTATINSQTNGRDFRFRIPCTAAHSDALMLKSRPDMLLSIVVPVYNEVEVLPFLLAAIRGVMTDTGHGYEIILVDDGSLDGTSPALKQAAATDPTYQGLVLQPQLWAPGRNHSWIGFCIRRRGGCYRCRSSGSARAFSGNDRTFRARL